MIILGIDPAIRVTGYGVIRVTGRTVEILDCGVIKNTQKMPHSECLRRLSGGIRELLKVFSPEHAVLEDPFVGRNAGTAIILGMARGAILAAIAEAGVTSFAYSPATAKKSAVGLGSATKEQVAMMMSAQLGIAVEKIALDATDALALAMCHAQKVTLSQQLSDILLKPL